MVVLDQSNAAAAQPIYGTLIVIPPGGATQTIVLYRSVVRLGQATDNDIVLPDETVQPYHAQLFCRHASFELLALSDAGATAIDGERLPAYTPYLLADNSVVQIGRTRIFVYPPDSEQPGDLPPSTHATAESGPLALSETGSYGMVVALGPDTQQRVPINRLVLWIGAAPDNDVVIPGIADYYAQLVSTPQGHELITLATERRTPIESVVEIAEWRLMVYTAAEAHLVEASAAATPAEAEPQIMVVPAGMAEPPAAEPPSEPPSEPPAAPAPSDLSATPVIIELPLADAHLHNGAAPPEPAPPEPAPPELLVAAEPERSYGTAILRHPDGQTQHISLIRPTIRLGRASDNDLVIDHSAVSDYHAQIFCTGDIFNLLDLNSDSGTKLDNRRLPAYAIQALSPDSVIQIGDLALFLYPPNATIPAVLPTPAAAEPAATLRLPSADAGPPRITRLKLTPPISTLEAGETATLTVSFVNQSLVLERVSLAVTGLPASWVDISEQEIPVFPSAKGEVKITITPPRDASSQAGSYPFNVQVWSEQDRERISNTPATLLIRPFTQFQIALFPRHQSGRQQGQYQVELTNQGNTDQSFDLHCFDELNAFEPPFTSRTIWVKSGTTYQMSVWMQIKSLFWWVGKRQGYHFVISARAADNQVEQARGIFIHVPLLSQGTKYPIKRTKALPAPPPPPPQTAPTTDLALRPPAQLARQQPPSGAAPTALAPRPRRQPEAVPVTGATRRLPAVPPSDDDVTDVYQPAHITLTTPNLSIEAGAAATTTLSVINRASVVDRLSFKVVGLPPAWVTIVPESIPLLPNAQAEAQIVINPPRHFRSLAETARFRVIAQSEKRPDQQVFALGALTIKPFTEFKQEIFPKEQKVRRQARYNLQVTNKGNQEQVFQVQGSSDEDLLDFESDQAELVVPPGETRKTQVRARVRDRQFIGTSRTHMFAVNVSPSGSPDLVQQSTARLTDRPRIPQWLVQIVLLPLVLLIIALFMLWGRTGIVGFVNGLRGKSPTPAAVVTTAGGATTALTETTVLNPPPTLIVQTPITNEVRWTQADSPKVLRVNYLVPAGTLLTIEPGVEVQLASRVRLEVAGSLTVDGTTTQPVTFRTADGGKWDGIYLSAGAVGYILNSQIEDAGARKSSLVAQNATLIVRDSTLTNNDGGIYSINSYIELQRLSITNNVFEQNPALALKVGSQGSVVIDTVSIVDNTFSANAAIAHMVLEGQQANLDVQNAVFDDQARLSLLIEAEAAFKATLTCNTFANTTVGLGINFANALPREAGRDITIADNAFINNGQSGLQSPVVLSAANNWWGAPSGPTDARRNPSGRGASVSETVTFTPWLSEEKACTRSP